jgi:hypothetical protein
MQMVFSQKEHVNNCCCWRGAVLHTHVFFKWDGKCSCNGVVAGVGVDVDVDVDVDINVDVDGA